MKTLIRTLRVVVFLIAMLAPAYVASATTNITLSAGSTTIYADAGGVSPTLNDVFGVVVTNNAGAAGTVQFVVTNTPLPAGITATFSPASFNYTTIPGTTNSTTLQVTVGAGVPAGVYPLIAVATNNGSVNAPGVASSVITVTLYVVNGTSWTGGGADNELATPGNWSPAGVSANTNTLFFAGSTRLSPVNNNFAAGTMFNNIEFDFQAGAFTLAGPNSLTLSNFNDNGLGQTLLGGILNYSANHQTISAPITLAPGMHRIGNWTNGFGTVSGSAPLLLSGAITRNTGGMVLFSSTNGVNGTGSTGTGAFVTNAANFNIIGGWAIQSADWASVDANGNVVPLAAARYTVLAPSATANLKGDATASSNMLISATGVTITMGAAVVDINSLLFNQRAKNQTVDVGAGNTLRLNKGGIWSQGKSFTLGANSGQGFLTAGGPTVGTAGELFLISTNNDTFLPGSQSSGVFINPVIRDNTNGAGTGGAVTVVVDGSWGLTATNTYSGGTYVLAGRLQSQKTNSLGFGPVYVFPGGQVSLDQGADTGAAFSFYTNAFFLQGIGMQDNQGNGAIRARGSDRLLTGPVTLMGPTRISQGFWVGGIGGSGPLTINGGASGNAAGNTIMGATNTYTGDTIIVDAGSSNASLNNTLKLSNYWTTAAAPLLATPNMMPHGAGFGNVIMNGNTNANVTTTAYIDLNGSIQTINGLIATNPGSFLSFITNSGIVTPSPATLIVGDNNQSSTFGGSILKVAIAGSDIGLTKIGSGTLTLTGTNTYTGPTFVGKGTLMIGPGGYISNSTPVTVAGTNTAGSQSQAVLDVTTATNYLTPTLNSFAVNASQSLYISNATLQVSNITAVSGGSSSIAFTNGTLNLSNTIGPQNTTLSMAVSNMTLNISALAIGSPPISVQNLAIGGTTNKLNLIDTNHFPVLGDYPQAIQIIQYSGTYSTGPGGFNFGVTPASLPPSVVASMVNNPTTKSVDLQVSFYPLNSFTWNAATNFNWDAGPAGTTNWWPPGTTAIYTNYNNGEQVRFDDNAATNYVYLVQDVSPQAMTVKPISFPNYLFEGPGKITGAGGMTLSGTQPGIIHNTGSNDFSGSIVVNGGTLQIGKNDAVGNLPVNAAVQVNAGASITFARSDSITTPNSISGLGEVIQTGSGTNYVTALNTYQGGTLVSGGEVDVGNGGVSGALGTGPVTNNARLVFNRSDNNTVANALYGSGTFIKSNANVLTLTGAGGNSGTFGVAAGNLSLIGNLGSGSLTNGPGTTISGTGAAGPVTVGGNIDPGVDFGAVPVPGSLTVTGLTMLSGATAGFHLNTANTVGGGVNDLITDNSDLTLNGNTVTFTKLGATLQTGSYELIDFTGNLVGTFSSSVVKIPTNRYTFAFDYGTANKVKVTVGGGPVPVTWASTNTDASTNKNWDYAVTANWSNQVTMATAPDLFFNYDTVEFNDLLPGVQTNVALQTTVLTTNILFNSATNYFIFGPSNITGFGGLTVRGQGILTLGTSNDFSSVIITNSTVQPDNNFALGATNVVAWVTNGGILDLSAQDITTPGTTTNGPGGLNLGAKNINVSGDGWNHKGALVGSGLFDQTNALRIVNLQGDTTFGGTNLLGSGRWDMRATAVTTNNAILGTGGNAYNLTKVGNNAVVLAGVRFDTHLLNIDVKGGRLGIEACVTNLGDPAGTLTVESNATFSFLNLTNVFLGVTAGVGKASVVMQNASTLQSDAANSNFFRSPITMVSAFSPGSNLGTNTFNVNSGGFVLSNVLSGAGTMVKTGAGTLVLLSSNFWSGQTILNMGRTIFSNGWWIQTSARVTAQSNAIVDLGGSNLTLVAGQGLFLRAVSSISTNTKTITVPATATFNVAGLRGQTNVPPSFAATWCPTNQTLTGLGVVIGGVDLTNGSTLAVGTGPASIGQFGIDDPIFETSGTMAVKVADATGGPAVGWDQVAVNDLLQIHSTPSQPFTFKLSTLSGGSGGSMANFSKDSQYSWNVMAVGSLGNLISGFDQNAFAFDYTAVSNDLGGGHFLASVTSPPGQGDVLVSFTNNHPPAVGNSTVTLTIPNGAFGIKIPINVLSNIANWSDPDGDQIVFVAGALGAASHGTASYNATHDEILYVTNGTLSTDSFTYGIKDTNKWYRNTGALGAGLDTVRTASGTINIVFGSPPSFTNAIPLVVSNVAGTVSNFITFAGIPGYNYKMQYATDLVSGLWYDLTNFGSANGAVVTNASGANGLFIVEDDTAIYPMQFYRSVYQP